MTETRAADPSTTPVWQPVTRVRSHDLVVEAVENQILGGVLRVGDPLPPERELASRLQVSRAGVREAIRVLESQGVVRSNVGAGREAGTFIAAMPSAALTRFLRLHVALSNFPMRDIIDARVMLERNSVAMAAARADDALLATLRAPLTVMDQSDLDCEPFNDADTAFHVAIAEASGNRLVADMTVAIRASLRDPILRAMREVSDWPGLARRLQDEHHGIFDAIADGDGNRAADLTEAHIRSAFDAMPLLHDK